MGQTIYQVDAFTAKRFAGNPAAVCILDSPAEDGWMQALAAEMNLAETAFLHPEGDGYHLRWFTPTVEVDLCGHATLASAHILWETGTLPQAAEARFHTLSGLLTATKEGDWITLDFPAERAEPAYAPAALTQGLGITSPQYVGKNRLDYLVEVADEATLRGIRPNIPQLLMLSARGIIVTCRSSQPEYDFLSRFFAPAAGIDEDPATGSAHCCLGPYWQDSSGKDSFLAYQASARGGVVRVQVAGERVKLGGQAVTVLKGELL